MRLMVCPWVPVIGGLTVMLVEPGEELSTVNKLSSIDDTYLVVPV